MQRLRCDRAAFVTIAVTAVLASCTSAPDDEGSAGAPAPGVSSVPTPPNLTPSTNPGSPNEPPAGPFELVEPRVSIRPPRGGSFRVRGLYPWSPSSCVRPDRPTLDGRYPGALTIRAVDDGR